MIILGVDTSCDETAISVLKFENRKLKILSNVVASQAKIHQKYGGVYPFLAKRQHQKNLPTVFKKALRQAQGKQLDFIAVTVGPGLEPCLWQGVNFTQDLAKKMNLPIISVNHIEAHILANWLKPMRKNQKLFPAICLVVSGGHTQLILMKGIGKYKVIGETRDDAAGECFDKTARILGLGYPGGPAIAKTAKKNGREMFSTKLPRPMIHQKNYDFSFSGLKTAVLYLYQKSKIKNQKFKQAVAAEIQQAIIDVLIYKTIRAAKSYKAKSIILGGGVAANKELRKQFKKKIKKEFPEAKFFVPDAKFCTDNAAMIALTAFFHQKKATKNWPSNTTSTVPTKSGQIIAKRVEVDILGWKKIKADANLNIR